MPETENYSTEIRKSIFSEGKAAFDAERRDPVNYVLECPYHSTFQPVAFEIWWNGYKTARGEADGTAPTWLDERD